MAIPAITREYTPGSRPNFRENMRLPHSETGDLNPLNCMQSNSRFPVKHVRSLDLLDGMAESPQEHPHKSRMTLISPKECEIVRCIPNQLKMMPDSPLLDIGQSPLPIIQDRWLVLLETPVSNLKEHQFQQRNSRKAPWTP